jgi:predicted ATP-grasp superfamily ATP-dependent carboligase
VVVVTEEQPSYGALAAVRALRAAGYAPWVAVASRPSYSARSRAAAGVIEVPDPARDRNGYVSVLAASAAELSAAALLPGTENALMALAGTQDAFPAAAVGAPEPGIVERATDKLNLSELAPSVGLETPPTLTLTPSSLDGAVGELHYPAVVKPIRTKTRTAEGRLRHGRVQRVRTPAELRSALERLPGDNWLVQPYLPGRLAAVCGVAWKGAIVCASHQLASRIYPPDCGISAYAVTVAPDTELEDRVARLLAALDWSGLFQAQFMRTHDRSYLIDLNLRMYGSLGLAVAAGLNLPAIWTDLLLGRTPPVGTYRVGVRYRSEEKDLPLLAGAFLRGRWGSALGGLRPHRRTVHAVFALRDPRPLLTIAAKLRASRSKAARS